MIPCQFIIRKKKSNTCLEKHQLKKREENKPQKGGNRDKIIFCKDLTVTDRNSQNKILYNKSLIY